MAVQGSHAGMHGRRFRSAHQPRPFVLAAALALALLCATLLLCSGAWVQRSYAAGLQLAGQVGSLAAWAGSGGASSSDSGSDDAARDLDAAIEARIPRYWAELERVCPNMTYRPCREYDAAQRTSLAHSQLDPPPGFRGLGRWHTLRLRSATAAGAPKARGGDTLWAVLLDPATQRRLPVRPFDEGDGTYTLAYVALAPGNYTLTLRLFYTLCAGFQDPFRDFQRELQDGNTTAHCFEGQKRHFESPVVAIPDSAEFSPIPDASGGSGSDPLLGHSGDGSRGSSSIGSSAGSEAAASAAATADSGQAAAADLAAPLAAPVLRGDRYVYRNGPLGSPDASLGLQLQPRGMLAEPWRLAAGPERQRLILWGDSTVKKPVQNLVALARYPCVWPDRGWPPRLHLEHWQTPPCKQVPSGQADPALEGALKGCTAGAELATVPVGCSHALKPYEMLFQDQVAVFNMSDWRYNDTFARQQGAWPLPKQFSIVYTDGWGLRPVSELMRDIRTWTENDTVIFNVGAHAVRLQPYAEWKRYIGRVAAALAGCPAAVVWRSTMPFAEHVYRHSNGSTYFSAGHFQNEARRVLFDSYAEFALRSAGVRFWDISAFALAGAYRPSDMFHLDGHTMRDLNLDMARQIAC